HLLVGCASAGDGRKNLIDNLFADGLRFAADAVRRTTKGFRKLRGRSKRANEVPEFPANALGKLSSRFGDWRVRKERLRERHAPLVNRLLRACVLNLAVALH